MILADATDEPLGHKLFREAWEQLDTNPRSAVVIGVVVRSG
jgi:hypothetical protein